MIRIYVESSEGQLQAMFGNYEPVEVCEDIQGDYLVGDVKMSAKQLFNTGYDLYPFIVLDRTQFADAVLLAEGRHNSTGVYKITSIEKTQD